MLALGEPASVGGDQHGHMGVGGLCVAEQPLQVHLTWHGREQVATAHDLGNAHLRVVYHNDQLVGVNAIAALDEKVAAVTGERFRLVAIDAIDKRDGSCGVVRIGYAQAQRRRADLLPLFDLLRGQVAARACIHGRAVACVRCAGGVELGARAEAGVGEAVRVKLGGRLPVQVEAIMLVDGALVPIEPEPSEVVYNLLRAFGVAASRIEVFDAQDHTTVLGAHGKPGYQRREDIAQMHAARRGGGEAPDRRVIH